ncbi:hypothetical protein ACFP1Z_03245 [Streptomyces gamaensis]|uniref:Nephrocystin 3-like N-terminal domain-containing protein n=1 Tax=Streptomyces gamaensis TaxID=1763542 RepID=A0ABW0YRS5_9ACTN
MSTDKPETKRLGEMLGELYEAAKRKQTTLSYERLIERLKRDVDPSATLSRKTISDWMKGKAAPKPEHSRYFLWMVAFLARVAYGSRADDNPQRRQEKWRDALLKAQHESSVNQRGGPRRINDSGLVHASAPTHQPHIAERIAPATLVGRNSELDELTGLMTAPEGEVPCLVWLQAPPWAGKSALLATFVLRCPPPEVNVVSYFVSHRWGTDRRRDFLNAMSVQLAAVAGLKKPQPSKDADSDRGGTRLQELYEAAARASAKQGRRLVLVVDGLDEDADAGLGKRSIASLLPQRSLPGLRVVLSGRSNPAVPTDVGSDDLLRDADAVVRKRLAVSSVALTTRDKALEELSQLLDDPVGSRLLGLLALAQGGLGREDLAHLIGVRPLDIDKLVRGVTGRSMVVEDAAPDTYVLAHDELRRGAMEALGDREMAGSEGLLHGWADTYRDRRWPETTPRYLLTGYTRLLHSNGDIDRLKTYVLDPYRQLRMAASSGAHLALTDLGLLTSSVPVDGLAAPDVEVLAAVAASRDFLVARTRNVSRAIPRACARIGDVQRARDVALSPRDAMAKAVRLAGVACELALEGHEQAAEVAREAADWAQQGTRQTPPLHAEDDEPTWAAEAAVDLIGAGHWEAGLRLLRAVHKCGSPTYSATARAAALLRPYDQESTEDLLHGLRDQAAFMAIDDHGDRTVAIEIWATVAEHHPDLEQELYERIAECSNELWRASAGLDVVEVLAVAASALAVVQPEEASDLASRAADRLAWAFQAPESLSAADRAYADLALSPVLARVAQALCDTGSRVDQARALVESVPEELRTGYSGYDVRCVARDVINRSESGVPLSSTVAEDSDSDDAPLLRDVSKLMDQARLPDARALVSGALGRCMVPRLDSGPQVPWLSTLAGALAYCRELKQAKKLAAFAPDTGSRSQVLASVSMACSSIGRRRKALEYACKAADTAEGAEGVSASDLAANGTWGVVAQALAHAGDTARALELAEREGQSRDGYSRGQLRQRARQARVAVAVGIAAHEPTAAARIVEEHLSRLNRREPGLRAVRDPLPELGELLLATPVSETAVREELRAAVHKACHEAEAMPPGGNIDSVLVHAVLRVAEGCGMTPQLDWLTREIGTNPEILPVSALCVLHALLGDSDAARRAAESLHAPANRAAALAAAAAQLAAVPACPAPLGSRSTAGREAITLLVRSLALALVPDAPRDVKAAKELLRGALLGDGWHRALPVLAQLAPNAVTRVFSIAHVHLSSRPTS